MFFPVVLLVGPARFLFMPLALAVVLAMLASYLLSRTLVPALARMLLRGEHHDEHGRRRAAAGAVRARFNRWRDRQFERFQSALRPALLGVLLRHRALRAACVALVRRRRQPALAIVVGTDFFPTVDAGLIKLHFRAPRARASRRPRSWCSQVEDGIREIIPADELETINDMIGVPSPSTSRSCRPTTSAAMDAEILIALKPEHHPTADYMRAIRADAAARVPG